MMRSVMRFGLWGEPVKEELEPSQEDPRRSVASRPMTSTAMDGGSRQKLDAAWSAGGCQA
jgi:hypothetical protein